MTQKRNQDRGIQRKQVKIQKKIIKNINSLNKLNIYINNRYINCLLSQLIQTYIIKIIIRKLKNIKFVKLYKLRQNQIQVYCQRRMTKSKKQKKKQKIIQKGIIKQKYLLLKRHYEQYQIPPYTYQHLRSLVLQFMAHQDFDYPIHHLEIFNQIKPYYHNLQNSDIYMKDLPEELPLVLQQLQNLNCLQIKLKALGTKLVTIVQRIQLDQVILLADKFKHQRPYILPPDIITFQQQKKQSIKQKQNKVIVQSLLSAPSLFQNQHQIGIEEQLKQFKTYQQKLALEEFKKQKNVQYCDYCTRDKCQKAKGHSHCNKKHFRAIITQNTDQSYGNCPHLNACHNPQCKLIHYTEQDQQLQAAQQKQLYRKRVQRAQWVNCDLRYFDFKILGKFDVIMADPPWDIHMTLPYGTMKDKQMLNLRVDVLQDQGLLFLWVTGRAMQLARDCMIKWGYKKVDQIVWVKTNQINRLIITGKTGHWLNHTKQHCLVGIKGNPTINKRLDCDVIVSKVRQTSRKPDQIYGIIQRMRPGGKKIELFGRPDNCMPGWLTLGNQLTDVRLKDPQIIARYKKAYPNHDISEQKMQKNLQQMVHHQNLNKVYNNHIQKNN